MGKASIVDEVAALIPERPGVRPWWERLDPKQAVMAAEILQAWQSGALGTKRRPAAAAISTTLQRHGVSIGVQGVDQWLKRSGQ